MSEFAASVDIRAIPEHKDKFPTVHRAFEALKVGEKMELINDHDFQPMFQFKFPMDFPDQYEWEYLEKGPEVWRAAVIKIK